MPPFPPAAAVYEDLGVRAGRCWLEGVRSSWLAVQPAVRRAACPSRRATQSPRRSIEGRQAVGKPVSTTPVGLPFGTWWTRALQAAAAGERKDGFAHLLQHWPAICVSCRMPPARPGMIGKRTARGLSTSARPTRNKQHPLGPLLRRQHIHHSNVRQQPAALACTNPSSELRAHAGILLGELRKLRRRRLMRLTKPVRMDRSRSCCVLFRCDRSSLVG
jgi:hypothetical protein